MAKEENFEERIYTIPLRAVKKVPRPKRAPYAIKEIKKFVTRHMKPMYADGEIITDYKTAEKEKKLFVGTDVNQLIWSRGIEKPPSKIRVKVVKNLDEGPDHGVVDGSLPDIG